MIAHKHSDLVARMHTHFEQTTDEKSAVLLSRAADVIDALAADPRKSAPVAAPDPAALLDLADKAARVRGGPFPVTPDLDAALRALQDRIAARLAEVLA